MNSNILNVNLQYTAWTAYPFEYIANLIDFDFSSTTECLSVTLL